MDCQKIEAILSELKVNSLGHIRGKNNAMNKIHSQHLKEVDSILTKIRVYVLRIPTGYSTKEVLKMIDQYLYDLSINDK